MPAITTESVHDLVYAKLLPSLAIKTHCDASCFHHPHPSTGLHDEACQQHICATVELNPLQLAVVCGFPRLCAPSTDDGSPVEPSRPAELLSGSTEEYLRVTSGGFTRRRRSRPEVQARCRCIERSSASASTLSMAASDRTSFFMCPAASQYEYVLLLVG